MVKTPLGVLTTPSTAITREATVTLADGDAVIRFDFDRDGQIFTGGVRFGGVRAFRSRAEGHCAAWHIDGAYDTVAQVEDSDWVAELMAAEPSQTWGQFPMRHYMLFVDGSGCFEVVAASWELLSDTPVR